MGMTVHEDVTITGRFQPLIPEDQQRYGQPNWIFLKPPQPRGGRDGEKVENWISWRAASYPAQRHSEYLFRVGVDDGSDKQILLSAVLLTPDSFEAYIASAPPNRRYDIRGRKATRCGYSARIINPGDHSREIWEIIHSSTSRQGRPIAEPFYERRTTYDFPDYQDYQDPELKDITCGVFSADDKLVAYLLGKRVGDHVQYDEIMGHADHLAFDVMYLLHARFVEACIQSEIPPKCLNYGPWYSGADAFSVSGGLNRWKRKIGFRPAYLILACS